MLRRVEAKDYLGVDALVASGVPPDSALSAARALFGAAFQPSESLRGLVYFEEGDLETI